MEARLIELYPRLQSNRDQTASLNPTVIAIPDDGIPSASSWVDNQGSPWLQSTLPTLLENLRVLEFVYNTMDTKDFSWQEVHSYGDVLIAQLIEQFSNLQEDSPIVFVCHGCGGLILKHALGDLYERYYDPLFQKVINCLHGIVFLGVPHTAISIVYMLSRLQSKRSKRSSDDIGSRSAIMGHVLQKFDDAMLDLPILSVYEKRKSIRPRSWFRSRKETVVDRASASIGSRNEQLVEVESNHAKICNLEPGSPFMVELQKYFESVQTIMREGADRRRQQQEFSRNTGMWSSTASEGGHEIGLLSEAAASPNFATAGSSRRSGGEQTAPGPTTAAVENTIRLPCYLLKPQVRNPDFFGRESILRQLDEALLPRLSNNANIESSLKTFAISGFGGVGKTQVAVEFAFSRQAEFDAVFWVNADETTKLGNDFKSIASELGLKIPEPGGDSVVIRDLVLEWLSRPTGESTVPGAFIGATPTWLLVFDNADDLNLLKDYWPVSGNGSVLVTSRDPLAKTQTYVHSPVGLQLEPFSPEEAAIYLLQLTGYEKHIMNHNLALKIATRLGGLPFATTLVAGTIRRRDLSFGEFLEFYDEEIFRRQILKLPSVAPKAGYNHTLFTVWAFEDLSPTASGLLDVLSFLDPDRIPESLFTSQFVNKSKDLDDILYPTDAMAYMDARMELGKSSIIRRNTDLKELSIHRLIQEAARIQMVPSRQRSAFENAVHIVCAVWPWGGNFDHANGRWPKCEALLPQILNLSNMYKECGLDRSDAGGVQYARLLMDAGWYRYERGSPLETRILINLSQEVCEHNPGQALKVMADNEYCLAAAASMLRDVDLALKHSEKALELRYEGKEDGVPLGIAHHDRGRALRIVGRFDEALVHADSAITIYEKTGVVSPCVQLVGKAEILVDMGHGEEAAEILLRHLKYREDTIGEEDYESFRKGLVLLTLGDTRVTQGRLTEGLEIYEKSLEHYLIVLGKDHSRTSALRVKMADQCIRAHHFERARELLDIALRVFKDLPQYKEQRANILLRQAYIHKKLNEIEEAAATESIAKALIRGMPKKSRTFGGNLDMQLPEWMSAEDNI